MENLIIFHREKLKSFHLAEEENFQLETYARKIDEHVLTELPVESAKCIDVMVVFQICVVLITDDVSSLINDSSEDLSGKFQNKIIFLKILVL
jgi:hypothetical protein